ncbi:hypothetical protein L1887_35312 [Cichorium endivia]|nr:hypothetical protein L1887_35312 [Cichorium endivia]
MLFTAKNDNIAEIKYRDSTFNIMYRGVPLGRGTVPGFYQAVSVDRMSLLQADAAKLVRMDRVSLSATPAFQKEWIGILVKPPHAFLLIYANFWGCMWCYRAPVPHLNDFLGLDHQVNDRFSCGAIVPSE